MPQIYDKSAIVIIPIADFYVYLILSASLLGVDHIVTYNSNQGGQGNPITLLKTYIESLPSDANKTYIISFTGDTHVTAIGEKHSSLYSSFLVFGYIQKVTHLKMENGNWNVVQIES